MGLKYYKRYSNAVTKTRRWQSLRQEALRRDGFRCVKCGNRHDLEVDHKKPVRSAPGEAYSLPNLQTLCRRCHSAKTRIEVGHVPLSPERQAWRNLLRNERLNQHKQKGTQHA